MRHSKMGLPRSGMVNRVGCRHPLLPKPRYSGLAGAQNIVFNKPIWLSERRLDRGNFRIG